MKYALPYISYTQINTYLKCPHEFWLTYYSGDFTPISNKYTELGSLLHEIFEEQGRQLIAGKPMPEKEAIRIFNKKYFQIDKKYFNDKEDWLKMYKKGAEAIKNYFEVYRNSPPLFVERKFFGEIAEGLPPAKSFIDRIDGDPNDPSSWIITDYKTGASPKSKEYLKNDIQLGFYASQVFAEFGVYPKALQFFHPVPNKFQTAIHIGDGVYRFTNQREPVVEFSVSDTIMTIREVVRRIVEEQDFHKVPDSYQCKQCSHYQSGACKPFDSSQLGWLNV
jgi:CRISPR/Cas system-associated exonuclease Cas4 (RecB family)